MSAWRASRADGQIIPQTLQVPGDKSISHRAAMLAALASGQSEIVNFLPGSDCLATVAALEKLGAEVTWLDRNHLLIRGRSALRSPQVPLDCGNSGTSMRLLAGLLAGQNIAAELRGDASLSTRPMRRVVDPLRRMGARIEALGEDGRPPLRIEAGDGLRGVSYTPPMPSAQVKSSVLLAGLGARGQTCVRESTPTPAITRSACCRTSEWRSSAPPARLAWLADDRCAPRESMSRAIFLRRRFFSWPALSGVSRCGHST